MAKRDEVLQLRTEQHLSLREIHDLTGVPKGTLSGWLKPFPLPQMSLDVATSSGL